VSCNPLDGSERPPHEALLSVAPWYRFRYTVANEAVDHDKAAICVGTEE
jgi:hypothetical protein